MFALSLAAGARVIWATTVIPGAPAGLRPAFPRSSIFWHREPLICRYLQLVVVPYGFTVDADVSAAPWLRIAGSVLLVIAMLFVLRRNREIATWWIGGLILLIPSSSFFPAADLSADRRMYLPMFCFAAALGLLLARIKTPVVFAAIALVLAGLSVQRTMVWMTEESLWREAVDRAPRKLRRCCNWHVSYQPPKNWKCRPRQGAIGGSYEPAIAAETGKILPAEGQPDGALEEFGRALALAPNDARNMNNRGVALLALGQTEAARADLNGRCAPSRHLRKPARTSRNCRLDRNEVARPFGAGCQRRR